MRGLAELSLGDLVRGAGRYVPVLLVVAAIAVTAQLLPPADGDEPAEAESASQLFDAPGGEDAPAAEEPESAAPFEERATFDVSPSPALAPAAPEPASPSDEPPPSPDAEDVVPLNPSTESTSQASETGPLRIEAAAWASQAGGTPLAEVGVPDGTLPVGTRLGQIDKASFVRLVGSETTLFLNEDPEGGRSAAGPPEVKACRIDEPGWQELEGATFDESPSWSTTDCVDGESDGSGRWTFDLSGFADRTDERGFALVPTADAPIDFQVAFGR
jgi:hypothetical protein